MVPFWAPPWGGTLHDVLRKASGLCCSCQLLLQLQLQKSQYLQLGPSRGQYYGGSLPNVNQIGSGTVDLPFQVSPCPPHYSLPPGARCIRAPPWPQRERASVCVGCCGELGSPNNWRSSPSPPPPTLFLFLGQLGQALPGSPCLSSVSRARSEAVVWPRAFRQPLHLLAGCAASGTARGLWGLAPSCLTNPQAQQFSEGGPVA